MLNDTIYNGIQVLLVANNITFDQLTEVYNAHQTERAKIKKVQDKAQAELDRQIKKSQADETKRELEVNQETLGDDEPEDDLDTESLQEAPLVKSK